MVKNNNGIALLRGVSIAGVMAFHFYPAIFPNGYWGVDIFFIISGYLMSKTIYEKQYRLNNIKEYYALRLIRLAPALLLLLICLLIYGWYFLYDDEYLSLIKYIKGIFLLSNDYYALEDIDYFSLNKIIFPLLNLWSLSIEFKFFLLIPIIILFNRKSQNFLIISLMIISVLLYDKLNYYNSLNYLSYFLWGVVIFKLRGKYFLSSIYITLFYFYCFINCFSKYFSNKLLPFTVFIICNFLLYNK